MQRLFLVNNPTYYGICSDIKKRIVKLAHEHGMLVLAEAMALTFILVRVCLALQWRGGADMAAVSMGHKTGGSLTQSSLLLCADTVSEGLCKTDN